MASDELLTKNIGEEFTCVGEWWLPRGSNPVNPKFKCFGTLTFSRGKGITLDVMGRLRGPKLPKNLVGDPVEMIWGRSKEGELITLVRCYSAGMTIGTVWAESYLVGSVFVSKNAWFTPGEHISFTSLTLQYTHLAEWAGFSGFQPPSFEEFNELFRGKKAEIKFTRPNDLPPINVGDYAVSIRFGNSWPSMGPAIQKATIEQHTLIFVESRDSKEIALDDALILARAIQNFLTLMMYPNPIYPLVIEGKVKIEEKESEKEPHATMRLLSAPIETKKPSEKITRRDLIFSYKEVANIWEGALNRMVIIEGGKLEPMFNEIFAEFFTPPEFTEDQFIAAIRALEALHRRTRDRDYYMPKEEYSETLLARLNEQVDIALLNGDINQDFQESLKKRLSCGYEYSLSARLDDLFTAYGTEFLALFVKETKSDFIRYIMATYNWLTHSNPEYRDDALERGEEFGLLNLRLELFTIAVLLCYIGIPLENVENMFKLHKFNYLRIPGVVASPNSKTNE